MIEFLTPGQRIKKIRSMLNMKQHELQGERVKRNFISMIENGKRGLSIDTAIYLADKFNNKALELGINLNINELDLLMSKEEEAKKYCLDILSENVSLNDLDQILNISIRFNLDEIESLAQLKKGDYYFDIKDYSKAVIYYVGALSKIVNNTHKQYETYLFNRMGLCKLNEMYYIEALEFFNKAYTLSIESNDLSISKNSIYNISLCYRKLNDFDRAIKYIDKFLTMCDADTEYTYYVYAMIIKANCWRDLKQFDNALEIYQNLLPTFKNKKSTPVDAYIYDNLGLLYSDYMDYEKALECLDKSQSVRTEIDIENLAKSLIDKSIILAKQEKYSEALILINIGIDMAKKYNDYEYQLKGYLLQIDIYEKIGEIKNLERAYEKVFFIVKEKKDYKAILNISTKLCLIYLEENNIDKVKELLKNHCFDI